jgi:hypothetical protein
MPTYFEHTDPSYVTCHAVGHYTFDETYNNYKQALLDEKSADGVNLLIDVRKSLETRSYEEMVQIAELINSIPSFAGKCAMLVSRDSLVRYGLARMLSSLADSHEMNFQVFTDEHNAIKWLKEDC